MTSVAGDVFLSGGYPRPPIRDLTITEGDRFTVMERVVLEASAAARLAVQADFAAIEARVVDMMQDPPAAVGDSPVSLTVASQVFDTLQFEAVTQNERLWNNDGLGFNFYWTPSTDLFPVPSGKARGEYLVGIRGGLTAGGGLWIGRYRIHVAKSVVGASDPS